MIDKETTMAKTLATPKQSHAVMGALQTNANLDKLEFDAAKRILADPKGSGKRFLEFLNNGSFTNIGKTLTINYATNPSLIDLKIESHPDRDDIIELDTTKLKRLQPLEQGEVIKGHEYLKRLKASGEPLLDVRAMEELIKPENQHLIPEEWKKGYTYFFGTIFSNSDGNLCVPYLRWVGDGWHWVDRWLYADWLDDDFAASLAIEKSSGAQ